MSISGRRLFLFIFLAFSAVLVELRAAGSSSPLDDLEAVVGPLASLRAAIANHDGATDELAIIVNALMPQEQQLPSSFTHDAQTPLAQVRAKTEPQPRVTRAPEGPRGSERTRAARSAKQEKKSKKSRRASSKTSSKTSSKAGRKQRKESEEEEPTESTFIPHQEVMRRLAQKGQKLKQAGGSSRSKSNKKDTSRGSSNSNNSSNSSSSSDNIVRSRRLQTDTCTDDSTSLADALSILSPAIAAYSSYFTCSEVSQWASDGGSGIDAILIALGVSQDIASAAAESSCAETIYFHEACIALGNTEDDCQIFEDFALADVCCISCCEEIGGDHCPEEEDTNYTMGGNVYDSEAVALLAFFADLNIVWNSDWAPSGKNICNWRPLSCQTGGYKLSLDSKFGSITGFFSDKLGSLQYLTGLEVEGSNHAFTSTLPSNIGQSAMLNEVNLDRQTGFIGTLPASLSNLASMASFTVVGCGFSGALSQDIFLSWTDVAIIGIADNDFSGTIPPVNLGTSSMLSLYNASHNSFTAFGPTSDPTSCLSASDVTLNLDLSDNKLTVFPEELRDMPRLGSLNLANNLISEIPVWGYWQGIQAYYNTIQNMNEATTGELLPCKWAILNQTLTPVYEAEPEWPLLTSVTLSNNPLGSTLSGGYTDDSSFRRLLALFIQAPSLSTLRCASCQLDGNIEDMIHVHQMHLVIISHDDATCVAQDGYTKLQALDLSDNSDIQWEGEYCDVLRARDADDDSQSRFECLSCPDDAAVPSYSSAPLASRDSCACQDSFKTIYTQDGIECGCLSGYYKDPVTKDCQLCEDYFNCSWDALGADPAETKALPAIIAGYWMPCLSEDQVTGDLSEHVYDCFHDDVCLGGSIDVDATDDDGNFLCLNGGQSLCAKNRTGTACALCIEGNYGDRDGECSWCGKTAEEAQREFLWGLLACVPLLYIATRVLGSDDSTYSYRQRLSVTNIPIGEESITGSATFSLRVSDEVSTRFSAAVTHMSKHYDSILRAVMMANLVFKSMQILALLLDLRVSWPSSSKEALNVAASLGVNFDIWFQSGCLFDTPSAASSLVFKWVIPLVAVFLTFVAWILSHAIDRGLALVLGNSSLGEKVVGAIAVNSMRLLTFVFYLWASFFAGLVKNSFVIFVCRENPNGKDTVLSYPSVECGSEEWFGLAAGGALSCLVYVVFYFAAAIIAFQRVAAKLKETQFKDRGAFTFAVEGLRTAALYWNIYAAGRDVCLNILVAVLVSQPGAQLLCAAAVLLYYAKQIWFIQPYAAATLNFVEWWFSTMVALLLAACSVFGFQSTSETIDGISTEGDWDAKEIIVLILLLASVGVPICCAIFEVLCIIPAFYARVPGWAKHPSDRDLKNRIERTLQHWTPEHLHKSIMYMDAREWAGFVKLIWGDEKLSFSQDLWNPARESRRSFLDRVRLKDGDLSSVHSRHMVIQRHNSTMSTESTSGTKLDAEPSVDKGAEKDKPVPDLFQDELGIGSNDPPEVQIEGVIHSLTLRRVAV